MQEMGRICVALVKDCCMPHAVTPVLPPPYSAEP